MLFASYSAYRPDLILTDVVMPNMNGLELAKKVREISPKVRMIYVSGFFGIEGLRRELTADIRNYGYPTLAKPFKMSALLDVVNATLFPVSSNGFRKGV